MNSIHEPHRPPPLDDFRLSRSPWLIFRFWGISLAFAILFFLVCEEAKEQIKNLWFAFCVGAVVLIDPSLQYEVRGNKLTKCSLLMPWNNEKWDLAEVIHYSYSSRTRLHSSCLKLYLKDGSRVLLRGFELGPLLNWCKINIEEFHP